MGSKNHEPIQNPEKDGAPAPALSAADACNPTPAERTLFEKVILAVCFCACFVMMALSGRDILDKIDLASSLTPLSTLFRGSTANLSHEQHALKILSENPLVDGHNDLAIKLRVEYNNQIYGKNFTQPFENGGIGGHVDLARMKKGKYGGAFWSAFWLCPSDIFNFEDATYYPIVRATLEQLDLLRRLSARYPTYFPPTPSAAAARHNFHKLGVHIAPLAIEGLHQIGNSFSTLRLYHSLGVRYATLNWNCHNIYSDAATLTYANFTTLPSTPYWGGLSNRGRVLVKEMNRLGMIVDLAHVSPDTMRDVLVGEHNPDFPLDPPGSHHHRDDDSDDETNKERYSATSTTKKKKKSSKPWRGSLAPPIISHSSVRAICPHPRNVPDDILPLVKRRNSVVMVNFSPDFIACHYPEGADPSAELPVTDAAEATLGQVARHIMYIGGRIGYDHVGIGSDFDGIESTPRGLDGVDKMPALVAELLRRGVSEKDVIKVVGGNVLRVWEEVDRVSAKLQKEGMLPAEDHLPRLMADGLL